MSEHIPGPWRLQNIHGEDPEVIGSGYHKVKHTCLCGGHKEYRSSLVCKLEPQSSDTIRATARLICQAPTMLALIRELRDVIEAYCMGTAECYLYTCAMEDIDALIAKIEGGEDVG